MQLIDPFRSSLVARRTLSFTIGSAIPVFAHLPPADFAIQEWGKGCVEEMKITQRKHKGYIPSSLFGFPMEQRFRAVQLPCGKREAGGSWRGFCFVPLREYDARD